MNEWIMIIVDVLLLLAGYLYTKSKSYEWFHNYLLAAILIASVFAIPEIIIPKRVGRMLAALLLFQAKMIRDKKTYGDEHDYVRARMEQEKFAFLSLEYKIQAELEEEAGIRRMVDHVFDHLKEELLVCRREMKVSVIIRHRRKENEILIKYKKKPRKEVEEQIERFAARLSTYYNCTYEKDDVFQNKRILRIGTK